MSSFTVKTVVDNPSWVVGQSNFSTIMGYLSHFSYTRYTDQTLVYCNNPETITSSDLGDNGYCLNKVTLNTENVLLYASHNSAVNQTTKFGVRVYNPNSYAVTITKEHHGFKVKSNWEAQVDAYTNYFQTVSVSHTIPAWGSVWIEEESVFANGRFEALMKYSLTGSLVMAVYLYKVKSNVGSNPLLPSINQFVYSGTANAFYISASNSFNATGLLASYYNSAFFAVSQQTASGNSNESNPITMKDNSGNTIIASEYASYYNNIGNWGLQYAFSTTLRNNKTSGNVKFKGYVISNPDSHCAGIMSGGVAKGIFLGSNGSGTGLGYNRWNFCETSAISPGGSITLDYQYMHLSRGNAPGVIQWEVVEL